MGWNDEYWKNRENRRIEAEEHHECMMRNYKEKIMDSVNNTKVYSGTFTVTVPSGNPKSRVENMDTVSAVFKFGVPEDTIVLNFASYKNPGGGFLKGSSAQEESLCMESNLYEVLSDPKIAKYYEYNNQHKNKSLYENRALLSPGIVFERLVIDDFNCNNVTEQRTVSVLTVAAPNRKAYMDYIQGATEVGNLKALTSRISFIADIINANKPRVVILGAYGCGVFGQDPEIVAKLFKKYMFGANTEQIIYAVIDKGGHSKEGAYAIFDRVIGER